MPNRKVLLMLACARRWPAWSAVPPA